MELLRATAAFLGGGRLGQPRRLCSPRRARRGATGRNRPKADGEAGGPA
jgi:hypothetical protein